MCDVFWTPGGRSEPVIIKSQIWVFIRCSPEWLHNTPRNIISLNSKGGGLSSPQSRVRNLPHVWPLYSQSEWAETAATKGTGGQTRRDAQGPHRTVQAAPYEGSCSQGQYPSRCWNPEPQEAASDADETDACRERGLEEVEDAEGEGGDAT